MWDLSGGEAKSWGPTVGRKKQYPTSSPGPIPQIFIRCTTSEHQYLLAFVRAPLRFMAKLSTAKLMSFWWLLEGPMPSKHLVLRRKLPRACSLLMKYRTGARSSYCRAYIQSWEGQARWLCHSITSSLRFPENHMVKPKQTYSVTYYHTNHQLLRLGARMTALLPTPPDSGRA